MCVCMYTYILEKPNVIYSVSLCIPGCLDAYSIDQAILEIGDLPASAF